MSNVGKWNGLYSKQPYIIPMADSPTYEVAARLFRYARVAEVEDWGCGYGWFQLALYQAAPEIKYVGIDGSYSNSHERVLDDLTTRRSKVEGIFMRHVLEHNYDWPRILDNALASFTELFVFVLFTPFTTRDAVHEELRFEEEFGVPTLALNEEDLMDRLTHYRVNWSNFDSPNTAYGHERLYVIEHL